MFLYDWDDIILRGVSQEMTQRDSINCLDYTLISITIYSKTFFIINQKI